MARHRCLVLAGLTVGTLVVSACSVSADDYRRESEAYLQSDALAEEAGYRFSDAVCEACVDTGDAGGVHVRMSAGQRNVFTKAEDAASKLLEMTPTKTAMAKTAQGRSAIDRVNKRISKIRKSAKPKSLTALNKRIRAIKPKKLKIGKASAATGSRLLRPRARVKGASALLPSAL